MLKKCEGIFEQEIGDELLLQNVEVGNIHMLNNSSAFIWKLLEENGHIEDIHKKMCEQYPDVDCKILLNDIQDIIDKFISNHLVYLCEEC